MFGKFGSSDTNGVRNEKAGSRAGIEMEHGE